MILMSGTFFAVLFTGQLTFSDVENLTKIGWVAGSRDNESSSFEIFKNMTEDLVCFVPSPYKSLCLDLRKGCHF